MAKDHITSILNDKDIDIKSFPYDELGKSYPNFNGLRNKLSISIKDYLYISLRTGLSIDYLVKEDPRFHVLIKKYQKQIQKIEEGTFDPVPRKSKKKAPVFAKEQELGEKEEVTPENSGGSFELADL